MSSRPIGLAFFSIILMAGMSLAQSPKSVLCQFERIATAELDSTGTIMSGADRSTGEMVITDLDSDSPHGSGNIGTVKLHILRRSKSMIWLAEMNSNEVESFITLFLKTGIVMFTKHETLRTISGGDAPLGFVEIGRFRPLK